MKETNGERSIRGATIKSLLGISQYLARSRLNPGGTVVASLPYVISSSCSSLPIVTGRLKQSRSAHRHARVPAGTSSHDCSELCYVQTHILL